MKTQPLRVGLFARRRLERQARRDAANAETANAAGAIEANGGTGPRTTPTIAAIQARATAYARREEQRFLARCQHELAEQRVLARDLSADLASYDERMDALEPADRIAARIALGEGAAFEEIRRLRRRIARRQHRSEELAAHLHTRFAAARLRASRTFDRSEEKIAVYWGAYRGVTAQTPERAPELERSEWLTTGQNALELWHKTNGNPTTSNPTAMQGRTDVPR